MALHLRSCVLLGLVAMLVAGCDGDLGQLTESGMFECDDSGSKSYIPMDRVCDGRRDCSVGEDEAVGHNTAPCAVCDFETLELYRVEKRCDGKADCESGIDELGCDGEPDTTMDFPTNDMEPDSDTEDVTDEGSGCSHGHACNVDACGELPEVLCGCKQGETFCVGDDLRGCTEPGTEEFLNWPGTQDEIPFNGIDDDCDGEVDSPDVTGACTDVSNLRAIAIHSTGDRPVSDGAFRCLDDNVFCLAMPDPTVCVVQCMESQFNLSNECPNCFAQLIDCVEANCPSMCLDSTEYQGLECEACRSTLCDDAFRDCSGLDFPAFSQ